MRKCLTDAAIADNHSALVHEGSLNTSFADIAIEALRREGSLSKSILDKIKVAASREPSLSRPVVAEVTAAHIRSARRAGGVVDEKWIKARLAEDSGERATAGSRAVALGHDPFGVAAAIDAEQATKAAAKERRIARPGSIHNPIELVPEVD